MRDNTPGMKLAVQFTIVAAWHICGTWMPPHPMRTPAVRFNPDLALIDAPTGPDAVMSFHSADGRPGIAAT